LLTIPFAIILQTNESKLQIYCKKSFTNTSVMSTTGNWKGLSCFLIKVNLLLPGAALFLVPYKCAIPILKRQYIICVHHHNLVLRLHSHHLQNLELCYCLWSFWDFSMHDHPIHWPCHQQGAHNYISCRPCFF